MTSSVETLTCHFIGDFKVADNIAENGKALCSLRELNREGVFNKLIVVQAGSIVEAALDQIIYRAQNFTREGVPNISEDDLKLIRDTKIDRFNNIIQAASKYRLLDGIKAGIYDDLHRLRQLRNRVHIQFDDEPKGIGREDAAAFNDGSVKWALDLCITVIKHLNHQFPRPKELQSYSRDICLPIP